MIPRAANLNVRTSGISWLASFLNKGVASSPVHSSSYIYIYIYLTSFLIFPISSLLIFKERACHFENFASIILLTSLPLLLSFC